MNSLNDTFKFRDSVYAWLRPLGYEIIWAKNHPSVLDDEVHFTVKGCKFRLVCIKDKSEEYFCFIYESPIKGKYYALRSRKYSLFSNLEESIKTMNEAIELMPVNFLKKSFLGKIKTLFIK